MPPAQLRLAYSKIETSCSPRSKTSRRSPLAPLPIAEIAQDLRELLALKPAHVGGIGVLVKRLLKDARQSAPQRGA